jgi:hypothetical protein
LTAAFGGYAVDAFDYMIYTFILPTLIVAWGMSNTEAGVIATGSLLSSAAGDGRQAYWRNDVVDHRP